MCDENIDFLQLASIFNNGVARQCEYIFQQTDVIDSLRLENFDLAISEASFLCGHALFDHIGIKTVINADSTLVRDNIKYALGEPVSTSYYPGVYSAMPDRMSLIERFKNLAGFGLSMYFLKSRHSIELEQIKNYYKGSQYPEDHFNRITYSMVNSNQYLDYASPVLPKTVFIGGTQVNLKKTGRVWLNKEWEDILNERPKNVLVSFGTNAFSSDMPEEYKSAFLQVFASMSNTTFIWKYEIENSTIADHLPNVYLSTWMPQNDLLADERLSLFVTHGGLGSTMELAYQGKPAVVIPLMTDQPRNAHMLTRHGGALQLDKTKLNDPSEIRKAIETVLNDENYKKNAKKLAQILEYQPNQPKDVVLKHCDFAVKFGPLETLNSYGRHLNIFEFYNIDICIIVILFICLVVKVGLLIMRRIPTNLFKVTITFKQKSL